MRHIKPLDLAWIHANARRLHIVATNIDTGTPHTFSEFESYKHYRECLKASVTIPMIAGAVHVDGVRIMDGGLVQQIAFQSAFAAGATKVLTLMTRREDEKYRPLGSLSLMLQSYVLQGLSGGKIGAIYRDRNRTINDSVAMVDSGMGPQGQKVGGIQLHHSIDYIHRLTQDPALLRLAAEVSKDHVKDVFASFDCANLD